MTIYLLKYNNYYNRKAKRLATLDEYKEKGRVLATFENIDMNPNDGVTTTQIVNFLPVVEEPDYLLACYENGAVDSRWFIMESQRTRSGQYNLNLRRDLVADYFDIVIRQPAFVEKGTLPNDGSDPFIFNPEQMTFNQILKSRIPLSDATKVPWVVMYHDKKTQLEVEGVGNGYMSSDFKEFNTYKGMEVFYNKWSDFETPSSEDDMMINYYYTIRESGNAKASGKFVLRRSSVDGTMSLAPVSQGGWSGWASTQTGVGYYSGTPGTGNAPGDANRLQRYMLFDNELYQMEGGSYPLSASKIEGAFNRVRSDMNKFLKTHYSGDNVEYYSLIEQIGDEQLCPKYCYVKDERKVYKVTINEANKGDDTLWFGQYGDNNLTANIGSNLQGNFAFSGTGNSPFFPNSNADTVDKADSMTGVVPLMGFEVTFEDVTHTFGLKNGIEYKQSESNLAVTEDAPYNIICMPYGNLPIRVRTAGQVYNYTASKEAALRIVDALARKYAGNNGICDFQIVPYCPLDLDRYMDDQGFIVTDATLGDTDDLDVYIDGIKTNQLLFYADLSSRRRWIEYTYFPTDYKVQSQTEFFRLVSPNGNGIFEFNGAVNHGFDGFESSWTLKPGLPYIHVKPRFRGLYGYSFEKDKRGLICGGDFSLAQITEEWLQYVLNNKNYQNSFDNQIENLENMRSIEEKYLAAQILAGSLQGGVTGASTGLMASGGNPYAAIAGGIIGAGTSFWAGQQDFKMSQEKYRLEKQYMKDQFGMALENIKARPNSLFSAGGITIDNDFIPILEFYQATDKEIQALQNKIKYNGMTIGRIGTFAEFLNDSEWRYTKGRLIQISDSDDGSFPHDYHLLEELSFELNLGLFMTIRGDIT